MVRVSVAVQVLAVVVLGPFMVMVEIKNRKISHLNMQGKGGVSGSFWMMMLWFGSWFVAGGWRGSGEAAAEHADGAVQQAGAAGLQRVPGRPAQVWADSAADHRRGEY